MIGVVFSVARRKLGKSVYKNFFDDGASSDKIRLFSFWLPSFASAFACSLRALVPLQPGLQPCLYY